MYLNSPNQGSNPYYTCPCYEFCRQKLFNMPMKFTQSQVDLMNSLRMLWEQHDVWTRATIVSLVFALPDVDFVTKRLLRNPADFGQALRPYYGDRIASKFSDLLKNHLVIAADLVKASKAGDNKAASEAEKKWYANADEIAAFLGSINPYWSEEDWRTMMHAHLSLVKAEAVNMLTKNYEAATSVYDEIERQSLEMADTMAAGIINQSPYRFMQ